MSPIIILCHCFNLHLIQLSSFDDLWNGEILLFFLYIFFCLLFSLNPNAISCNICQTKVFLSDRYRVFQKRKKYFLKIFLCLFECWSANEHLCNYVTDGFPKWHTKNVFIFLSLHAMLSSNSSSPNRFLLSWSRRHFPWQFFFCFFISTENRKKRLIYRRVHFYLTRKCTYSGIFTTPNRFEEKKKFFLASGKQEEFNSISFSKQKDVDNSSN